MSVFSGAGARATTNGSQRRFSNGYSRRLRFAHWVMTNEYGDTLLCR